MTCIKMKLGEKDGSGRARPVPIPNSEFELKADYIILATGQEIAIDFIAHKQLETKPNSYEIQIPNVFIGGDALRGGSTVINAVGDGRKIAQEIIEKANIKLQQEKTSIQKNISTKDLLLKKYQTVFSEADIHTHNKPDDFQITSKSLTKEEAVKEASRCLYCDEICNICTTLCPNLALFPFDIEPIEALLQKIVKRENQVVVEKDDTFKIDQKHQILVIADWCNECGNCSTFCPTSGAPYQQKPHLYLNYNAYEEASEGYYYDPEKKKTIQYKKDNQQFSLEKDDNLLKFWFSENYVLFDSNTMKIISFDIKKGDFSGLNSKIAAQMSVILQGAQQI